MWYLNVCWNGCSLCFFENRFWSRNYVTFPQSHLIRYTLYRKVSGVGRAALFHYFPIVNHENTCHWFICQNHVWDPCNTNLWKCLISWHLLNPRVRQLKEPSVEKGKLVRLVVSYCLQNCIFKYSQKFWQFKFNTSGKKGCTIRHYNFAITILWIVSLRQQY